MVTRTITATAGAGGAVSPSGAVAVPDGGSQTFTITANPGFHIGDVVVDGASVGNGSSYTFTNVTSNHTLAAGFAANSATGYQGIVLSWRQCADPGNVVSSEAIDCAGGAVSDLVGTFTLDQPITDAREIEIELEFDQPNAASIPAFWQFGDTGCDPLGLAIVTVNPSCGGYLNSWNGAVNAAYSELRSCGSDAREFVLIARGLASPRVIGAYPTKNIAFRLSIDPVDAAGCAGCDAPMAIRWTRAMIQRNNGATVELEATDIRSHARVVANRPAEHLITAVPMLIDGTTSLACDGASLPPGAGGTITPSGPVGVADGASPTFTIAPRPFNHVTSVLVDGVAVEPMATYTFTNVTADHRIEATFAANSLTNPAAQALPYLQDFGGLPWGALTYPPGWQGWVIGVQDPFAFPLEAGPILDAELRGNGDASRTGAGIYNYQGKIGFLNEDQPSPDSSPYVSYSPCLSLNTLGAVYPQLDFTIMTIRNPGDYRSSRFVVGEVWLQARVGTSGPWTTLASVYTNIVTPQVGPVTTPQQPEFKEVDLSSFSGHAVVQVRWVALPTVASSGEWSWPSYALDDVSVATATASTPAGNGVTASVGGITVTYPSVSSAGYTQLVDQTSGPAPPTGSQIVPVDPVRYHSLSTTASYSGAITVCVPYALADVHGSENGVRLMHYDATLPGWVDITTSRDLVHHVICGTASHFSPFALMEPAVVSVTGPAPPDRFALYPCAPNPLVTRAHLRYDLPVASSVRLAVYDMQGRLVRTLEQRAAMESGQHEAAWDGRDSVGRRVRAGIYLIALRAGHFDQARRVVVTQ